MILDACGAQAYGAVDAAPTWHAHTVDEARDRLGTRLDNRLSASDVGVRLSEYGTGPQWVAVLGLALVIPVVGELDAFLQRRRTSHGGD